MFIFCIRSLDQAILLLKDLQDWKEIANVAHKACQLFQEHGEHLFESHETGFIIDHMHFVLSGSPDTAALLLDKSGKIIEPHLPEEALILYKYEPLSYQFDLYDIYTWFFSFRRAMEVVMIEDRPRQASEFASRAGRLLVKLGRFVVVITLLWVNIYF